MKAPFDETTGSSVSLLPQRGPRTILVIDDDTKILKSVKRMLERHGYAVILAANGREGIDLFQTQAHMISAVVLDMNMPDMNGSQVLYEIRRIRSDATIILASGYSQEHASGFLDLENLSGFITKPFLPDDFIKTIDLLLAGKE